MLTVQQIAEREMPDPEVGPWGVVRSIYHADRQCLCNSALRDFRQSVLLFHGRYIAGTLPPVESTEAMNLGTALHLMCLEPEKFADEIAVAPEVDRRTKLGKLEWEGFCADAGRKIVITAEQHERCQAMASAILSHAKAREVIRFRGPTEQAIRWQDPDTGLWVRNLLDKWLPSAKIIVDLKSTKDPTPAAFARSIVNFGYHAQAALYSAGAQAVFGVRPEFLFIVVGNEPPHEVCCCLLDSRAIELGETMNQRAMRDIAARLERNDWRSRYAESIETLTLPAWAYYQETP